MLLTGKVPFVAFPIERGTTNRMIFSALALLSRPGNSYQSFSALPCLIFFHSIYTTSMYWYWVGMGIRYRMAFTHSCRSEKNLRSLGQVFLRDVPFLDRSFALLFSLLSPFWHATYREMLFASFPRGRGTIGPSIPYGKRKKRRTKPYIAVCQGIENVVLLHAVSVSVGCLLPCSDMSWEVPGEVPYKASPVPLFSQCHGDRVQRDHFFFSLLVCYAWKQEARRSFSLLYSSAVCDKFVYKVSHVEMPYP